MGVQEQEKRYRVRADIKVEYGLEVGRLRVQGGRVPQDVNDPSMYAHVIRENQVEVRYDPELTFPFVTSVTSGDDSEIRSATTTEALVFLIASARRNPEDRLDTFGNLSEGLARGAKILRKVINRFGRPSSGETRKRYRTELMLVDRITPQT